MIYFTSDTHFWHFNVIEYCGRPIFDGTWPGNIPGWASREEACEIMNQVLIQRWNERITNEDEVYHLGDFFFCGTQKASDITRQLNGRKYWIRGNHDHASSRKEVLKPYFEWIRDYYELHVHDSFQDEEESIQQHHQTIVLCHFPILSWNGMANGTWHLHGHCHGSIDKTWNSTGLRMDVGVDTNNLYPYEYNDIKKIMALRTVTPVDHHTRNL